MSSSLHHTAFLAIDEANFPHLESKAIHQVITSLSFCFSSPPSSRQPHSTNQVLVLSHNPGSAHSLMLTFISVPLLNHRASPLSTCCKPSSLHRTPLRASLDQSETDWRAFRARLVQSENCTPSQALSHTDIHDLWAHSVPFIEKGTVLIASPEHFTASHSCAFFANTLVYILEHNSISTTGLILNRPIARSLPLLPTSPNLNLGGPVGLDTVVALHRDQSLGRPVVGDIRAAGFKDVVDHVEQGLLHSEHCRFFCGYSGWAPGQLQAEVDEGVWYTCATSDNLIMEELEDDALSKVLRLMGGRFGDIAKSLDDRKKTNS